MQVLDTDGRRGRVSLSAEGRQARVSRSAEGRQACVSLSAEDRQARVSLSAEGRQACVSLSAEGRHARVSLSAEGRQALVSLSAEDRQARMSLSAEGTGGGAVSGPAFVAFAEAIAFDPQPGAVFGMWPEAAALHAARRRRHAPPLFGLPHSLAFAQRPRPDRYADKDDGMFWIELRDFVHEFDRWRAYAPQRFESSAELCLHVRVCAFCVHVRVCLVVVVVCV